MSLGPMELALILGIALLVFGPSRLPGLGRSLGDAIRGFKKGMEGEDDPQDKTSREQLSASDSKSTNSQSVHEKDKV